MPGEVLVGNKLLPLEVHRHLEGVKEVRADAHATNHLGTRRVRQPGDSRHLVQTPPGRMRRPLVAGPRTVAAEIVSACGVWLSDSTTVTNRSGSPYGSGLINTTLT